MHIVHTENSCGWGGQEIRILTESKGFIERGHQVTIVCDPESNIFREAKSYGINRVGLKIDKKRWRCLQTLRSWIKEHSGSIDVINTHSSTDSWLTAIACASLKNSPPIVRTRHVSSPVTNSFANRWLYGKAVSHVAVTGEKVKQQLQSGLGLPTDHFTSVPTGIDLNRFFPANKSDARKTLNLSDRCTVGILATMRGWKGHSYLIQAFVELQRQYPDTQLLLVGDGPMRDVLEKQIDEAGLAGAIILAGNQDNPEQWLNAMDVFVLPSWGNEGVSQSVMQAMATGLPVIATDVGGMTEIVMHNSTGLIVPTKSAQAITDALVYLMEHDAARTALAKAGLALAQNRFGLTEMVDKMQNIFDNAIAQVKP